jgi:hypothetical protein
VALSALDFRSDFIDSLLYNALVLEILFVVFGLLMTVVLELVVVVVEVAHLLLDFFEALHNHLTRDCELFLDTREEVVYLLTNVVAVVYRIFNVKRWCYARVNRPLRSKCELKLVIDDHTFVEKVFIAEDKKEVSESLTKIDGKHVLVVDHRIFKVGTLLSGYILQKSENEEHDPVA